MASKPSKASRVVSRFQSTRGGWLCSLSRIKKCYETLSLISISLLYFIIFIRIERGVDLMLAVACSAAGVFAARRATWWLRRESVSGQSAVVTGGAGGLGLQIALQLARRGAAAVVLLDLEQTALDSAVEKVLLLASELRIATVVRGYACNVADPAAVKVKQEKTKKRKKEKNVSSVKKKAIAQKIENDVGSIDILVNNAGIVSGKSFLQLTEEQIKRTFNVNTVRMKTILFPSPTFKWLLFSHFLFIYLFIFFFFC